VVVVNIHDVTTQRELEQRLRHDAMHDPLTGLLNRAAFLESLARAKARSDRQGSVVALLYIDLDQFKQINDALGHPIGDQVLVEVSARLREASRSGETVGRLGGDEFVVLVEAVTGPGALIEIAERMLSSLRRPVAGLDATFGVSASIGIAMAETRLDDIEELMLQADEAMYAAKRGGRDRWALAAPEPVHLP
jgi:diguanylate cyclase (GGDEF)-like protein